MRFTSPQGVSLEIGIAGYQFPQATEYWDANWLMVSGTLTHPRGAWAFVDPCLTTSELDELASWLDRVARGTPDQPCIHFMEPCLEFCCAKEPDSAIEVRLAHECAPPWLGSEERGEDVVLRFPLAMNDPGPLARVAREFLKQFPLREFPE